MSQTESSVGNPFESLHDPNYRIYWLSMCLSSFAIWIQNAAQPWLAYSMTDSPMLLGTVSALQFTPMLLLSPFSGVLIDRFSKRTLLLISQAGFLMTSSLMAVLVFSGAIRFGLVAMVAVLTGLVNVVNLPLRQAWISSLVPRDLLVNAVALYSSAFNLARIVGPAVAGFVMNGLRLGFCYAMNAALFTVALIGLTFVHPIYSDPPHAPITFASVRRDLVSGLRYAVDHKQILVTLLELAATGIFSINYSVLLPVLSVEVLHSDELGFGILMSVVGVGTFFGAFVVATWSKGGPQKFFLRTAPVLLALTWPVIAMCGGFLPYIALIAGGFFYVSFSSTANVVLQLWTEPAYVGRIISFYTLVIAGTSPIGNLYSGRITEQFGVRIGAAACGIAALLCLMVIRVGESLAGRRKGKSSD